VSEGNRASPAGSGRPARRSHGAVVLHQVVDEQREQLRPAGDAGLAVDRVGLRLHRAFRGLAHGGDLGGRKALDGEERHIRLGRRQAPFGEPLTQQLDEGAGGKAEPFLGHVALAIGGPERPGAERNADAEAAGGADLDQFPELPRHRVAREADIGRQDIRNEEGGADDLHQEDADDSPGPRVHAARSVVAIVVSAVLAGMIVVAGIVIRSGIVRPGIVRSARPRTAGVGATGS